MNICITQELYIKGKNLPLIESVIVLNCPSGLRAKEISDAYFLKKYGKKIVGLSASFKYADVVINDKSGL